MEYHAEGCDTLVDPVHGLRDGPVAHHDLPVQALDREQPVLPMAPGVAERRTRTYVRNGTTSLFAALDIAMGAVIGKCYKRLRAIEFLDFLIQTTTLGHL